jgi:hypothetical protein
MNSDSKTKETKEEDPITGVIGDSGRYQLLMCLLIAFFEVGQFSNLLIAL